MHRGRRARVPAARNWRGARSRGGVGACRQMAVFTSRRACFLSAIGRISSPRPTRTSRAIRRVTASRPIQGTLVVCDADRGTPLACMDANEITALRTAAATAVAAKYLSRQRCDVAGDHRLRAAGRPVMCALCRSSGSWHACRCTTSSDDAARSLAELFRRSSDLARGDRGVAVRRPSMEPTSCVTCTTSTEFLLGRRRGARRVRRGRGR